MHGGEGELQSSELDSWPRHSRTRLLSSSSQESGTAPRNATTAVVHGNRKMSYGNDRLVFDKLDCCVAAQAEK